MDIRLIVSDIDRTLLPESGIVSLATVEAVRACRAQGTEFVVASGRWFPAAREISAGQLGIEDGYMIICNGGAVVRSDGTALMERGLEPDQARAVYDVLTSEPVMLTSYVRGAIYRLHMKHLSVFHLPERSSYFGGCAYNVVDEDAAAFEGRGLDHPYKMEAHSDDYALLARLRAQLEGMGLQVNSSFPFNLEIMAPGTGKGAAVRWLTAHLGLRREQVMGFGDYTNDLPMLENVGWPMAVDNALPEVTRACRAVVPACGDDGVAWAIHQYVLGDAEL